MEDKSIIPAPTVAAALSSSWNQQIFVPTEGDDNVKHPPKATPKQHHPNQRTPGAPRQKTLLAATSLGSSTRSLSSIQESGPPVTTGDHDWGGSAHSAIRFSLINDDDTAIVGPIGEPTSFVVTSEHGTRTLGVDERLSGASAAATSFAGGGEEDPNEASLSSIPFSVLDDIIAPIEEPGTVVMASGQGMEERPSSSNIVMETESNGGSLSSIRFSLHENDVPSDGLGERSPMPSAPPLAVNNDDVMLKEKRLLSGSNHSHGEMSRIVEQRILSGSNHSQRETKSASGYYPSSPQPSASIPHSASKVGKNASSYYVSPTSSRHSPHIGKSPTKGGINAADMKRAVSSPGAFGVSPGTRDRRRIAKIDDCILVEEEATMPTGKVSRSDVGQPTPQVGAYVVAPGQAPRARTRVPAPDLTVSHLTTSPSREFKARVLPSPAPSETNAHVQEGNFDHAAVLRPPPLLEVVEQGCNDGIPRGSSHDTNSARRDTAREAEPIGQANHSASTPNRETLSMGEPEQKDRGRRWLWRGGALALVVVVVVVAAIVATRNPDDDGTPLSSTPSNSTPSTPATSLTVPTAAPTSRAGIEDALALVDQMGVSSRKDLETPGTPQYKAILWLANEGLVQHDDPVANQTITMSTAELQERYIAAVLFYSLGLEDFIVGTGSTDRWLSKLSICDWNDGDASSFIQEGISCSDNDIGEVRIQLQDHGLQGSIPSEIGYFSSLKELTLTGNDFMGSSIPTELSRIVGGLNTLILTDNNLEGTIPTELGLVNSLERLDLSENALVGPVPSELGNCSRLSVLELASNLLTGSIPTSFQNDTTPLLRSISLSLNKFEGVSIPTELFSVGSLESILLDQNDFVGGIPTEIGMLSALISFDLGGNPNLSSIIPTELGMSSRLQSLQLDYTDLSGTIPSEMGLLTGLTSLQLNGNRLQGTLPIELSQLSKLTSVLIDSNFLSGSIPDLSTWTSLRELRFTNNDLSGSLEEVCDANPTIAFACADCSSDDLACSCCAERNCCT